MKRSPLCWVLQNWLRAKHLPLLNTLERTIKLLHGQHKLICAAVLERLLVEVTRVQTAESSFCAR